MRYARAIVVGASSGIGRELVRQLAASGCRVAAVARRADRLEALRAEFPDHVVTCVHDVTHTDEVAAQFQALCRELGGLDLLVYAAGIMPKVGLDEFDVAKDRAIVETNLIGAMAWLNEGAMRFQGVGAGSIVAIGSVAGDRGRRGQPAYHASKAGLATFMESLRNRLAVRGVRVVTVKPGPVDTEMTADAPYGRLMSAESAARKILKLAHRTGEHYLKPTHAIAFWIIRNIPSWVFRRMKL